MGLRALSVLCFTDSGAQGNWGLARRGCSKGSGLRRRFGKERRTFLESGPIFIWEFPQSRGTLFGGDPYNKDPTVWGTIFGSPIFGNSQIWGLGV